MKMTEAESVNCAEVKRNSTAYLDGKLTPGDVARLKAHLDVCESCGSMIYQMQSARGRLLALDKPKAPVSLSTELRVLASRERAALIEIGSSRWARLRLRWRMRLEELMRPLTIPATGGLLSSVALFATLALSITHAPKAVGYEVPVVYEDSAAANLIPVDMRSSVVLTMSLDDKGRIQDYAVNDGAQSYSGDASRLSTSTIAMPRFPTVLAVAHPVTGDVRISLKPLLFRQ
jgi:anti-sigma factor RsiW